MILHLRLKHAFDWYQCSKCNIWRNQPCEITSHVNDLHNNEEVDVLCPCCKSPISCVKLEEHCLACFQSHHKSTKSTKSLSYNRNRYSVANNHHKCRICFKVFKGRREYYSHLKADHGDEMFRCDHDGCDFVTVRDTKGIKMHKLRFHKENIDINAGVDVFCDLCGRKFPRLGDLEIHQKHEHDVTVATVAEEKFPCLECEEIFDNSEDRNREAIQLKTLRLEFQLEKRIEIPF